MEMTRRTMLAGGLVSALVGPSALADDRGAAEKSGTFALHKSAFDSPDWFDIIAAHPELGPRFAEIVGGRPFGFVSSLFLCHDDGSLDPNYDEFDTARDRLIPRPPWATEYRVAVGQLPGAGEPHPGAVLDKIAASVPEGIPFERVHFAGNTDPPRLLWVGLLSIGNRNR